MTCSMVDKQDKNPLVLEYDRKKTHSHIKMKEMADCFDYIEIQELISKNQIPNRYNIQKKDQSC